VYSGKAQINLLSYNRETPYFVGPKAATLEQYLGLDVEMPADFEDRLHGACRNERYSPNLLMSKANAKNYMARVAASDDAVDRYMTFDGGEYPRTMTINQAGVVAICYCAVTDANGDCNDRAHWIYAGRITIRGPWGTQTWVFATQRDSGFPPVHGSGLGEHDRLRIVSARSDCTDNSNNPAGVTSFRTNCPSPDGTGCEKASRDSHLKVAATTSTSSGNSIIAVVLSKTKTTLVFSSSIAGVLKHGDIISMDHSRIIVNGNAQSSMTPGEKYDSQWLAGLFEFQDDVSKTYLVGHRLSSIVVNGVVDLQRMTIPVGWASGQEPAFAFSNGEGHWARRDMVAVDEQVKSDSEAKKLKAVLGCSRRLRNIVLQGGGQGQFRGTARHDVGSREVVLHAARCYWFGGALISYLSLFGRTRGNEWRDDVGDPF
jgi:hypothetical protein